MNLRTSVAARLMGLSAIALLGFGTILARRSDAQVRPFGGGQAAHGPSSRTHEDDAPERRVYYPEEPTAEALATWVKLKKRITFPFKNEAPLEDILKYISDSTSEPVQAGPEVATPPGRGRAGRLKIFVDPIGLQEAEKSLSSPCTVELDDVTVATGLTLVLRQLGLDYRVRRDGILLITVESQETSNLHDPNERILNELEQLRRNVNSLRDEIHRRDGRSNKAGNPTRPFRP